MEARNTIQRSLVYEAVQQLCHPTAEEAWTFIHQKHPSVSKATVYRNLGVLAQSGALRKISLPDGADHFDSTLSEHYHIRCRLCGLVADVDMPHQERMTDLIKDAAGFLVEGHDIILKGLCPACAQRCPAG